MNDKKLFEKYYVKLVIEGIIKSLIFGLVIGFGVSVIPAFFSWLYNYKGLGLSIGIGFAALAIASPIIYFVFFKPSTKQIAERIDRLGLDERLITMMELEKDQSYIAMRQREDAKTRLGSFNKRLTVAMRIPIAVFIMLGVLAVCSITMITVSAISVDDKIGWTHPGQWEEDENPDQKYIRIRYEVDMSQGYAGGFILGPTDQLVAIGQSTVSVIAMADIGYMLESWSDGLNVPERADKVSTAEIDEIVYTAKFVMEDLTSESEAEKESNNPGEPDEEGDPNPSEAENERYKYANQFFDEYTYYRDMYQEYYDEAMEILLKGGDIPVYLREMIEAYYGIIL